MSRPIQATVRNRILAALPAPEFALAAEHLTRVEFALGSLNAENFAGARFTLSAPLSMTSALATSPFVSDQPQAMGAY